MKLCELTAQYVTHKQSMGMRFRTEQRTLKSFCRAMGDIAMADVQAAPVLAFIAGTGPVTRFWHRKHEVLVGFYRFAIWRGYCAVSPLPTLVPKRPPAFVPYIYSHEELQHLLDATSICEHPRCQVRAYTYRTLILLLYGAGLRIHEALTLTLHDVSLSNALIQIRETKFYKTRLVPIGPDLGQRAHSLCQPAREGPFRPAGSPILRLAHRKRDQILDSRFNLQPGASTCQGGTS